MARRPGNTRTRSGGGMVLDCLSLPVEGIVGWASQVALQSPLGDAADRRSRGADGAKSDHIGGRGRVRGKAR
jgi:hypothetical protein